VIYVIYQNRKSKDVMIIKYEDPTKVKKDIKKYWDKLLVLAIFSGKIEPNAKYVDKNVLKKKEGE